MTHSICRAGGGCGMDVHFSPSGEDDMFAPEFIGGRSRFALPFLCVDGCEDAVASGDHEFARAEDDSTDLRRAARETLDAFSVARGQLPRNFSIRVASEKKDAVARRAIAAACRDELINETFGLHSVFGAGEAMALCQIAGQSGIEAGWGAGREQPFSTSYINANRPQI